ncbi:MAG: 2,3-bisphosphoglycerate-independent phosphoglycerate mutase [Firmicutes bacterium]|nr:2,3-bisphosphoglycerate-independent phosphoglycerate mutase [Bacillota bacterium]
MLKDKKIILVIMDGWGVPKNLEDSAITPVNAPNVTRLADQNPYCTLPAHGKAVGLPVGQMGGSEVGHLCLGAGRVVPQALAYIDGLIEDGTFFKNEALKAAFDSANAKGGAVHLMGLLSPGGVHTHSRHLYALLRFAKASGVKELYLHAFLDGRDVPPKSAREYIEEAESVMKEEGLGSIATVAGRYYPMDRDNRWDRVKKGWDAIVLGRGRIAASAEEALDLSYQAGVTDEFVEPTVVFHDGKPLARVEDGDSVIFFNFRGDRARELTRAFNEADFAGFDRETVPKVHYVCFMDYLKEEGYNIAFSQPDTKDGLAETLSKNGLKQLHTAETEKFAHVTFFFNGGREEPFEGEERILVPSPRVATYDLKPEMSAHEVAETTVRALDSEKFDFIVVNFANCDMVGHTGVYEAAVKAVQTVDYCVGRVVDKARTLGWTVMITADHGNADEMRDPYSGEISTAHSLNPVPFIVIGEGNIKLRKDGDFGDVAPTILEAYGLEKPSAMTGRSLVAR